MSFCAHKWDSNTNQPKESGLSVDNIIDYVRCKMYEVIITNKEI